MKYKDAIESYLERKVKKLNVHADPLNSNCVAFRAILEDKSVMYFMYNSMDGECSADTLEEVEFESWPPESKKSNMMSLGNIRVS